MRASSPRSRPGATNKLEAKGLGAYIAQQTEAGDFHRIVLGIAVMSLFVVIINRLFWRPLYLTRNASSASVEISPEPFQVEVVMSAALLDIHALRQTFPRADGGELLVLDGIELELKQGQIVGLLGRTGSGKSTLLRLIAGLMQPAAGSITYLGQPVTRRRRASPWCSSRSRCSPGSPSWKTSSSASRRSACRSRNPHAGAGGDRSDRPRRL